MINKISKLKNFGIFHDFSWKAELPEFKKFNLIYGWNRSGKTTISRAFASCEKKCVYDEEKFKQYPENGEFEIRASNNTTIKNTNVSTNSLPVKVFNKDFIDENISFDPLNSSNPIVYVSEEDIESKKNLEKLKSDQVVLERCISRGQEEQEEKGRSQKRFFDRIWDGKLQMFFLINPTIRQKLKRKLTVLELIILPTRNFPTMRGENMKKQAKASLEISKFHYLNINSSFLLMEKG